MHANFILPQFTCRNGQEYEIGFLPVNGQRTMQYAITILSFLLIFSTASSAQEDAPKSEPQQHPVHSTKPRNVAEVTLFQDTFLAENAMAVHQRATSLAAAERYDFLLAWVLPSDDHSTYRFAGEFTTTNPAPV